MQKHITATALCRCGTTYNKTLKYKQKWIQKTKLQRMTSMPHRTKPMLPAVFSRLVR